MRRTNKIYVILTITLLILSYTFYVFKFTKDRKTANLTQNLHSVETIKEHPSSNKNNELHNNTTKKVERVNPIKNEEKENIIITLTPVHNMTEKEPVPNNTDTKNQLNNENIQITQEEDYQKTLKKKTIFSFDITKFSDNPELKKALKLLEDSGDIDSVKNIQKYGMRVKFDDFLNVSYKRESYFGMSAYNQYGSRFILINSMYKTAPTEQLACLIAHESMHILKSPTIEEETIATKKEAECWNNLRNYIKEYPETKLTERLNKISKNTYSELEAKISHTEFYQRQYK